MSDGAQYMLLIESLVKAYGRVKAVYQLIGFLGESSAPQFHVVPPFISDLYFSVR
jgi:hypothetical protein